MAAATAVAVVFQLLPEGWLFVQEGSHAALDFCFAATAAAEWRLSGRPCCAHTGQPHSCVPRVGASTMAAQTELSVCGMGLSAPLCLAGWLLTAAGWLAGC